MRILFTRFPKESAEGGAENQTEWLMQGLLERGHAVSFLGHCPVLLRRLEKRGIPSTSLDVGEPPVTKWGALSFLWRRKRMRLRLEEALETLMRDAGPLDAVCMLSLSEKLLLTPWCLAHGIRVFWIEHDPIGRWLTWNPWLPLLRRLSHFVKTVCVSRQSSACYLSLGFDSAHLRVIGNGVPSADVRLSPQSSTMLRIGVLARLAHEKGVDTLLHALRSVEGVSLSIVGQGPERKYISMLLAEDVRRTGAERITLQPSVSDVDAWYASIDVLVLPSRSDPFGLVVAEAMMRGIPTVVSDACGIADVLTHEHDALLVPSESVTELFKALSRMKDIALRQMLSANGRATAEKECSLAKMITDYEATLREGSIERFHEFS